MYLSQQDFRFTRRVYRIFFLLLFLSEENYKFSAGRRRPANLKSFNADNDRNKLTCSNVVKIIIIIIAVVAFGHNVAAVASLKSLLARVLPVFTTSSHSIGLSAHAIPLFLIVFHVVSFAAVLMRNHLQ